jgi:hypothetical protein
VHDGTDVTILHVVIHLMAFKSMYNYIVKLIIDLILEKHNILND